MFEVKRHVRELLSPRYEIVDWDNPELSAGVVMATDCETGQRVVIKFHDTGESTPVESAAFRNEVSAVTTLDHPNVIRILHAGTNSSLIYYVMTLVEGGSVWSLLKAGRQFSVHEVVVILRQVAAALAHMHSRKVTHRDIQIGNILLTDGHVTVIDFGLTKPLAAPFDAWIDVRSLGETGYELLTGRHPYGGENQQQTRIDPLQREPIHICRLRPDIPRKLGDVIMRTMDSANQWSSAEELYAALEPF